MKVFKVALAVGGLASLLIAGSTALAASAPAGGSIRVFVTSVTNSKDKILFTGAIGDYGTEVSVNANGKVNPNGNFEKVSLKQGGFWVNVTAFNKKFNKAGPKVNKANCSSAFIGTGPVTLFNGSGLYTGISGTVNVTVTFAGIAPRFASGAHKGQCNVNSNNPLGAFQSITGTGKVKFS